MAAPRPRVSAGRAALAAVLLALGTSCGSRPPPAPPAPPATPLHVAPACALAPAAGIAWIVDAKPRAIAEIPDLIPAIALVLPEERLRAFTAAHGGVDLRQVQELCVARYGSALLYVARVPLDPAQVMDAFEERATSTVTRAFLATNPRVVRMSAEVAAEPQQLVVFGREAVAVEQGKPGPLRAAEAFAFGKLKKAAPALKGAALARASAILGDAAPVRVFAPGPFEDEAANGLGGLLRAATAVGVSAKWAGSGSKIAVRLVVTGAWGDDAPAAAERLGAAVHVLSESAAGHLFGLHRPIEAPAVHLEPDALVLDAVLDGAALARGVHDAVDAEVADIMRR